MLLLWSGTERTSGRSRFLAKASARHGEEVAIQREAHIPHGNEHGEDVTHMGGLAVVLLGDLQSWCWHDLLPSQAHVGAENNNGHDVEETPAKRLEDLELHSVDVAHSDSLAARIIHPEKVQSQLQEGLQVQQVRRWAQCPWLSGAETELIQVDHHESQQGDPRNRQVHLPRIQSIVHADVPRPFDGNHHMQQSCQQNVLLHNVGLETESSPVQPHVEVSVAIEVIRSQENVQVANCVDDDEDEEEHGRASQSNTVTGEGHILLGVNGEEDLLQKAQDHVEKCTPPAWDLALSLHADLPILF